MEMPVGGPQSVLISFIIHVPEPELGTEGGLVDMGRFQRVTDHQRRA